jgi:hypothetical protein
MKDEFFHKLVLTPAVVALLSLAIGYGERRSAVLAGLLGVAGLSVEEQRQGLKRFKTGCRPECAGWLDHLMAAGYHGVLSSSRPEGNRPAIQSLPAGLRREGSQKTVECSLKL